MLLADNQTRRRGDDPSWADRVIDALRRVFVPERQPVLVPVVVRPGIIIRRDSRS